MRASRVALGGRSCGAALTLAILIAAPGGAGASAGPGQHPRAEVVLAGGCYWGVESVFDHVRGVISATSGYATPAPSGGAHAAPDAEAVRLVYDPALLPYREILRIFFTVVHDPTQLNRQGPDVGAEYRSVVFVRTPRERAEVRSYIDSLSAAHSYPRPIVTEIAALGSFALVPESQQHYAAKNPTDPYIVVNDAPKLAALHRRFPALYHD